MYMYKSREQLEEVLYLYHEVLGVEITLSSLAASTLKATELSCCSPNKCFYLSLLVAFIRHMYGREPECKFQSL